MSSDIFTVDQVIGKTLWAQTRVNVRNLPSLTAKVLSTVNSGDRVGVVYSYKLVDGKYWWMLEDDGSKWVQHNVGWYSVKAIKAEGAKTVEEVTKEKAEAEKGFFDKVGDFFGPTGSVLRWLIPAGIVVGGFLVIDRIISKRQTK